MKLMDARHEKSITLQCINLKNKILLSISNISAPKKKNFAKAGTRLSDPFYAYFVQTDTALYSCPYR